MGQAVTALGRIELIGRICEFGATPYIISGLLWTAFGPASLSIYDAFLMGTAAVPATQVAKAIFEGKTFEKAVEEVCKKPFTSILLGAFAVRVGSQIGLDPRTSFTIGIAAIPATIAFEKLQTIKRSFSRIFSCIIQKIKDIFARIYQFLIDQLIQVNKIIQRTFNKGPKINKIIQINTIIQQAFLNEDFGHDMIQSMRIHETELFA